LSITSLLQSELHWGALR